jgi:hypothetical protein
MNNRPSLAKLQATCDAWNAKYPIGTPVICKKDGVGDVETVTTSSAQVLSGHSAVIWMEGISGCYLLSCVRPRS